MMAFSPEIARELDRGFARVHDIIGEQMVLDFLREDNTAFILSDDEEATDQIWRKHRDRLARMGVAEIRYPEGVHADDWSDRHTRHAFPSSGRRPSSYWSHVMFDHKRRHARSVAP